MRKSLHRRSIRYFINKGTKMPEPDAKHLTDFDRFKSLTHRILTTPKAELTKHAPKKTRKATTKNRK